MASYGTWVSSGEGQPRVNLLETDDQQKASDLVGALLKPSGTTTFDVGVTITKGQPPVEPTPEPHPEGGATQQAVKAPESPKHAQGTTRR